jgi:D-glycero-alpha-D-manno-heptose 1-phosphate guanylyltransferase
MSSRIKEAIILAGGLGTRLRSAVPELPKCMAPVNGQPFLGYVIRYLQDQGIEQFIFALGYKQEYFLDFLQQTLPAGNYRLSVEKEPLGTGGAIRYAASLAGSDQVLVTNGDTLFKGNLDELSVFHSVKQSNCTLLLKPMQQFDRYGVVNLDSEGRIDRFREKQFYASGLINAGMYALQLPPFLAAALPEKFSFEKEYLEALHGQGHFYGLVQDAYFIDIGIPEDYTRAAKELSAAE